MSDPRIEQKQARIDQGTVETGDPVLGAAIKRITAGARLAVDASLAVLVTDQEQ